jgi:hypothetical protein
MGLRALWESEESRKRRADLQPGYMNQPPEWLQQGIAQDRQGMARSAEEQQATAARGAGAISQGVISQGETMRQGLNDAVSGGLKAYGDARQRTMAEEQLALQRRQAEQQGRLTEQQIAAGEDEAKVRPDRLAQEGELLKAQIVGATTENRQKEMTLAAAQAMEDFYNQPAAVAQLPGARPGETVRQYNLRAESETNVVNMNAAKAALARTVAETEHFKAMSPYEQKQAAASLENTHQTIQTAKLQQQSMKIQNRQQQMAFNVNLLAGQLAQVANDPAAFNALSDRMVQENGALPGEVGEARQIAMDKIQNRQMQQAIIQQSSPIWQMQMQNVQKKLKYEQAFAILMEHKRNIDGPLDLPSNLEDESVKQIQKALSELGKDHLAAKISQSWSIKGWKPQHRSSLVKEVLEQLSREWNAELSANKDLQTMPSAVGMWDNMNQVSYQQRMNTQQAQQQNIFGGLQQFDFSQGGGPK